MSAAKPFSGLSMSVFTAFGWAGETAALEYALGQLDTFIHALQAKLSRDAQRMFPVCGLDTEGQTVYLAVSEAIDREPHIRFAARPAHFELRLSINNRTALLRGLKSADPDSVLWHRHVSELGPEWSLHVQQVQVDEENGEVTSYQDIYKDTLDKWDLDASTAATSRTLFLNNDPRWLAPWHIYRRWRADPISIMGDKLVGIMAQEVEKLMPIVVRFAPPLKPVANRRSSGRTPRTNTPPAHVPDVIPAPMNNGTAEQPSQFTYIAELKPLHIRKGFINLTAEHWPFFADSPRTGTRKVTLYYNGKYDKETAVWRLQPEETARVVLGEKVQGWFAKAFDGRTQIKVTATKLPKDEIQINLSVVE